jgi:biotin operon repressor
MTQLDHNQDPTAPVDRELKFDPYWFHVFKSMVDNDLRTLGPYAFAVYCVIKSHCSLKSGLAEPGIETIAEKAGISARQVMRELKTLQNHGYVKKIRVRKHNGYRLQERLSVFDPLGEKMGVAELEYQPAKIQQLVGELREMLRTQRLAGSSIHIEKLQVIQCESNIDIQVSGREALLQLAQSNPGLYRSLMSIGQAMNRPECE